MKTKVLFLLTLAVGLASPLAWSQQLERKLVLSPALADADDQIAILVTNSGCYTNAEVFPATAENHSIAVQLTYQLGESYNQCLQENPEDFETTVGPFPAGEYSVTLFVNSGAHGSNVNDEKFLSIIDAPIAAALSDGGINGLYHRPDSPHQYFYVLETVYTTLLVWNTFDAEGNQLWVYGVGDLFNGGQTVVTEAYINRSVGFLPSGEPEVDAEPWGVIRLDMTSCSEGTVTYKSDLPEFEDGEFDIVRLAYSKQIGCTDIE